MKTSKSQLEANKRYREKNKAKINYSNRRRDALAFVKIATDEDLSRLKNAIIERESKIGHLPDV